MTNYKQSFGRWGEKAAVHFLEEKGLKIIGQNWRSIHGEIDIIAKDADGYVFVEVKTRGGDQFGFPENAVTKIKSIHLVSCILDYIEEKQIEEEWRIDVVSIRKIAKQPLEIKWFQNAIREE